MDGLGWEGLGRDDTGVRVASVMQDNYLGSKFMRWCRLAGKMVRRLEVGESPRVTVSATSSLYLALL